MANTLDEIVTFFRVSPLQQISALGVPIPVIVFSTHSFIENYSQGSVGLAVTNAFTVLASIGCFWFNESLAVGKMQEYSKVKSVLDERGWDEKIIEPKSHSWCQRNMVKVASDHSGFRREAREYLRNKGYKWYNFF